jgi:C_GCAxxG_C_C family probable redox protein
MSGKKEVKRGEAEREALIQEAYERALNYELEFGCCPQCVLSSLQETIAEDYITDGMIKASHGLSGGGALDGHGACGALTGGIMALSAKFGRDRDKLDKGRGIGNFQKTKELTDRFRQTFGGTTCEELQREFTGRNWDMWKAEEYKGFGDARGDKCGETTAIVTRWVAEMLEPPASPAPKKKTED